MSYDHILLHEAYEDLRPGPVLEVNDGPYREMHARPAHPADNMGPRQCKAGHWSLGKVLWECVESESGKRLRSVPTATVADNVTLARGEYEWGNIRIEAAFRLLEKGDGWGGPVGLVFRFLDSARYYAAAVDRDGQAKLLKHIVGNHWNVLASKPCPTAEDGVHRLVVEIEGDRLRAVVAGVSLEASDGEYRSGLVGFVGARPAEFGEMTVSCTVEESLRLAKLTEERSVKLRRKRARCGRPVLWKRINTQGFGCGRRIRFGDLTGDGNLDFLCTRWVDPPNVLAYMAAVDIHGRLLWERGRKPPVPEQERSCDTPVQIHDIDGDGRNEVVCVMDGRIMILDGATGEERSAAPLPRAETLPEVYKNNTAHWGGGYDEGFSSFPARALTFADFAGIGRRSDIVLSGNYHQTVALSGDLEELWRHVNIRGHYPIPYRPRGETRDHLLCGFHHLDADASIVGKVCLQDHQDAIYVGPLDDDGSGPDTVLMASGEDGLLIMTEAYNVHNRVMGHVQRLSIGKFRREVPGLCIATVLFHHNRGIVSCFDSTAKLLWSRDFPVMGQTLQPVLFDDSGEERMLFSGVRPSQGCQGGLIDGTGDLVSLMPDDGGPGFCTLAYDFDGDGLDEIMVWDYERIWVYHSDAEVDRVKLMVRERPPLYNTSNFQAYYSRPPRRG